MIGFIGLGARAPYGNRPHRGWLSLARLGAPTQLLDALGNVAHVRHDDSKDLATYALLMMNQANIADIVEVAITLGIDPSSLVDVLKMGSASSNALTLLGNVEHLARIEALDMHL